MNRRSIALVIMMIVCLLPPAGMALAEAPGEVVEGQASYASVETMDNIEEVGYDGDPHRLIYVQTFDGRISSWVVVPAGKTADAYVGRGVRYTIADTLREESDEHAALVEAGTLEVFAESAEGRLLEISDTEVVVDVTYSSVRRGENNGTMRFTITEDTQTPVPLVVGEDVDVLYDEALNAIYLLKRNG